MDDCQDRSKATAHEHQSSTGKKNFQSEVRVLLQQLSSWREESNRQFTKIIDSHASTINVGLEEFAEEVFNLRNKLSAVTQERNDLLNKNQKLSSENGHLKVAISIVQPLADVEGNQKQDSQRGEQGPCRFANEIKKEGRVDSARNGHEKGNPEQEHNDVKNVDTGVGKENENHSNDMRKLYDSDFRFEIKHEAQDECDQKQNQIPSPADNHSCPECSFLCSTTENLAIHMKMFHLHKCDKCHYKASQKGHLRQHVKSVHDRVRDHKCEVCAFATARKSNLKKHRMTVHKLGEEKLICQQCPYATNRKSRLRIHVEAVHDKIRDHKCEECEYAFSEKSKLRRHVKYVHKKEDKTWVKSGLIKRESSPVGSIY